MQSKCKVLAKWISLELHARTIILLIHYLILSTFMCGDYDCMFIYEYTINYITVHRRQPGDVDFSLLKAFI